MDNSTSTEIERRVMPTDEVYELSGRDRIATTSTKEKIELGQWLGVAGALGGSGPRSYRPPGYGHPARKSSLRPQERKKRTAKKKVAKRSRKRNRK